MAEIAKFVQRRAALITPQILKGVHKRLPFLKLKLTEFDDPGFPHLSEQLEFLADVVEDFAEGVEEDSPYATVVAATFALVYTDRQIGMIPDALPELALPTTPPSSALSSPSTKRSWPPTPSGTTCSGKPFP